VKTVIVLHYFLQLLEQYCLADIYFWETNMCNILYESTISGPKLKPSLEDPLCKSETVSAAASFAFIHFD